MSLIFSLQSIGHTQPPTLLSCYGLCLPYRCINTPVLMDIVLGFTFSSFATVFTVRL